MKLTKFLIAVMLCAPPIFAQQPAQPSGPPPYPASPTFPQNQDQVQVPKQAVPPDTKAPPESLTTAQVRQQIQEKLRTEPELGSTPIHAKVNDHAVVLKGKVENERQHDLALRIAQSYAGGRQIVDHIKVRQPS